MVAGIVIAGFTSGSVMKAVFACSCGVMAAKMLAGGDRWHLGDELPGNPINAAVGMVIGLISTLIGIGGGVYVSTYMTLYSRPIHQAVATSSAFGPIIAIPAVIGYAWAGWNVPDLPAGSAGYVSLLGAAIVVPVSVLAAPLGVRIAHGISRRKLEVGFALLLLALGTRFVVSLMGH